MTRRQLLIASVGAAAAATGLGWSAWRERRSAAGSESADPAAGPGDVWSLRFPQPGGGELVMADLRGRPLVLNFWATWCPPCVKEMPALDRFYRARRASGWQVVGLAIDGPTPVRDFLARVPIGFPIGLAGFEGTELSRRLGNEKGALPFTVVFGRDGQVTHRKLGETTFEELERWAAAG